MTAAQSVDSAAAPHAPRGISRRERVAAWLVDVRTLLSGPISAVLGLLKVPTALGWSVIAAATALLWVGLEWGWVEFLIAGGICTAALVLALPLLIGRSDYTAKLDLARARVVVGERAVGALHIANATSRALLPVTVDLPVGKGLAQFRVPRLASGDEHEEIFSIPTQRRAVLTVGPVTAVRGDPLGLLARVTTWTEPEALYVHPRTISLDGSSAGILQDLEGLPTRDLSNADVAFHALREYVAGDDRRHVHWRSSARTGILMVRQFEETRRSHLAVGLSTFRDEYATEDDFELAVSAAASIAIQAIREEKQLTTRSQHREFGTRTGRQLLDGMAAAELTDQRRGGSRELALALGQAVPNASVMLIITGTLAPPTELNRVVATIPIGVQSVIVRVGIGETFARQSIGGAVILTIGDLAELPRAMRRVTS